MVDYDIEKTMRVDLESAYGVENVFTTDQVREMFEVIQFAAPCVLVKRKSDGKRGLLTFTHMPRFYFDFTVTEA